MVDLQTLVVYRLSDGARADVVVPLDAQLRGTVALLDDEEIAFLADRLTERPYIEMVRYDSLSFE